MQDYNLLLLPEPTLNKIKLIQTIGFIYGGQDEFIEISSSNPLANSLTIIGEFAVDRYPGIVVQHILSGHWWFHGNDDFPLKLTIEALSVKR